MKPLQLFICMLIFPFLIVAQERTISGVVTAISDNLPLPGVNVYVKDTNNITATDFDGKYTIKASQGDTLVFAFIGMKEKTVIVGTNSIINVQMVEDVESLEEVVVVGYGKSTLTATPAAIRSSSRKRSRKREKGFSHDYLQGQVTGLTVTAGSGQPGGDSKIVLRGIGSTNGTITPLYVIDGMPANEEAFKSLKPRQVKTYTVLKDAAATSIYGSRGANGVIVVTTKRGKKNPEVKKLNELINESYDKILENHFERPQLAPLSTFSIDVDKAAYSNIRRMINNGQKIPKHAVKLEEIINYFEYDYDQPQDEHPFSIFSEVVQTPWHSKTKLVRIGIQGKTYENQEFPASNLTFLIDVSGSMNSANKLALLKNAFKLLVNQLREKDKVSIVVYAGAAGVVLEPTSGNNKEKIIEALNKLRAGGSTAGGAGIELAYKLAQDNFIKNGNNRVILATDGDFNVGASSDDAMQELIEEKRKSGVFLSVLGFGYGNYKDSKLEVLADKGNGNHAYIDNMQEAQKVFGKEFGGTLFTIAKDVKIQVEFNPNKVEGYRLIGYENRLLAAKDFADDTKDAGELGSGHSVTALYEVIPKGVDLDYLNKTSELKYTKNALDSLEYNEELFTVKFRYKKPDQSKSIEMVHVQKDEVSVISTDLQFASAVALFGMRLRESDYDNDPHITKIIELAENGKGRDKNGYRSEFIRLVKTHESLK